MNRTAVEQIKERLPIDEVIGTYIKLDRAGKSLKARCPFHNEKSASFFVSPERGGYYCFGCGAKGDIFSFVEQFEGLDFKGALKVLADRAGVPLVFDQKADNERDLLYRIMEETTLYFEQQFAKSPEAQKYVSGRGITDETRKLFRIGWVPEGWRNLYTHLKSKNYPDAVIEKAGLAKKSERITGDTSSGSSNFYDRFRGRVMFPISDSSGRVIAFTGRILVDDGKSAKYLNSPDTPLYDKSMVLYGLDKAKTEIRLRGYSIFVEGQMDLVLSHQAGVKNTVAASGTALTDEALGESGVVSNLGLVRRLTPNVIIAFDSDAAGRKAALRAAGIALSMGMDVKIADLPEGKDPADMVRDNVESWKDALRNAKQVIEFELGNVIRDNPDPRKVPRALRDRVFPFLARLESAMDQAHFVKMIADRTHTQEDAVWQDLRTVEKTIKTAQPAASAASAKAVPGSTGSLLSPAEKISAHVDMLERRMIGLLHLMEKENLASPHREMVRKVADERYEPLIKRLEPILSDLQFEAEAVFGTDAAKWEAHMKELIVNFEENTISEDLIKTMHELRVAEKEGNTERMAELAKKCQVLSIRKAEVKKKRS
jgi:DNA primase